MVIIKPHEKIFREMRKEIILIWSKFEIRNSYAAEDNKYTEEQTDIISNHITSMLQRIPKDIKKLNSALQRQKVLSKKSFQWDGTKQDKNIKQS